MSLSLLSVAFPFAPVTADPVGGAEQVLSRLDRALIARGHRSIVIAPEGSSVAGDLIPLPAVPGEITPADTRRAHAAVREAIEHVLERERVDLVHLHGLDFINYLPPPGPPVLITLHLPLDWYPAGALNPTRPRTFLHPVSHSQAATRPEGAQIGEPIGNGVEIADLRERKRRFAFALGRICPEKGFDDALEAARRARIPLLLAGSVFGYPTHQAHLREEIAPRLDWRRRWIGSVEGERKQRLLAQARCVLIPSKARETSSLVAMEAIAAGTPVIAYPSGALSEIIEHGRTGYLVEGIAGLADAIARAEEIDPEECRRRAAVRFSAERMISAYLERYHQLV